MTKRSFRRWRRSLGIARPLFSRFSVVLTQNDTLSRRFKTSYWDGAIIAAAHAAGADTVLSEDLSHGQKYGDVTVIDPFKSHSH